MEKLLTIIVPAYNAEKTVGKCLSSLEIDWLEVIAVTGGSADGTAAVCAAFASRRPDIYTLINKENGGHGSALNAGFAAATGKYVAVINSDDYASIGGLARLEGALMRDADVLISDYEQENMLSGKTKKVRMDGKTPRICTLKSLKSPVTAHSIAVRRTLINFTLTEGCYYDDIQFVLYSVAGAVSFYYTGVSYYICCARRDERSADPENIYRRRADYVRVLGDIVDWYTRSDKCNDSYIFGYITGALIANYNRYTSFIARDKSARQEIVEFDARLKSSAPMLYREAGKKSPLGYVRRLRKRAFRRVRLYAAAFNLAKNFTVII